MGLARQRSPVMEHACWNLAMKACGSGTSGAFRARLAELGLDWNAPTFPPEPEDKPGAPPPLQLTVLGGELLTDPAKLAEYDRSVTMMRLLANPLDAQAHLETARRLMDTNEPAKALVHFRVAALTRPESYPIRMGIAQCLMKLESGRGGHS